MAAVNQGAGQLPATPDKELGRTSSVHVAVMPWAFTQHQPLSTSEFISQAKRRGFDLDVGVLRELYRHGMLVPFVYVSSRQASPKPEPAGQEPRSRGTSLTELRHARDRGRLSDLAHQPFRPRLRFVHPDGVASPRWWNGLLYSQYQLLMLPQIERLLARVSHRLRDRHFIARLPEPDRLLAERAARFRTIAIMLAALEARYLPTLDPERVRLTNAEPEEWVRYRAGFDPVALSARLDYPPPQARQDAEFLLQCAHQLDPLPDSWTRLMRRAPHDSWDQLKDAALLAMDYREAAEILLLFYEDLSRRGQAEPLPAMDGMYWHPLQERLGYRHRTLDEELMELGLSPHPRVVLAVEGDTEYTHVPMVWKALDYPDAPELMRLLNLRGVDRNVEKVAALAATPLVGERLPGRPGWRLIKPPTRLMIAVDPEGAQFGTPDAVARTRRKIMRDVLDSLKDQGVTNPNPAELDELVDIRTWPERCYEYAHFKDDELANAIMAVHHTIDGWSRDELIGALEFWRKRGEDIKRVWESGRWDEHRQRPTGAWQHEVSKPELAIALWPTLQAKIDDCRVDPDAPIPPIVKVVRDAYHIAQRWRYLSFALSEAPAADAE
jgi:hypothetical protein